MAVLSAGDSPQTKASRQVDEALNRIPEEPRHARRLHSRRHLRGRSTLEQVRIMRTSYHLIVMQKVVPVSSKGQVVIPAPMRKRLEIGRAVVIKEEGGMLLLEPSKTMEESFGAGGEEMVEVAVEISKARRREVESENS